MVAPGKRRAERRDNVRSSRATGGRDRGAQMVGCGTPPGPRRGLLAAGERTGGSRSSDAALTTGSGTCPIRNDLTGMSGEWVVQN